MSEHYKKALIYCRVSTKKQAKDGAGLSSQEHRCRVYAAQHDLEIEKVFTDDVTGQGDFLKRKGMVALIAYLESHPEENYAVIFDDLKRLARDALMHLTLRMTLDRYSVQPHCLNFNFDSSPEGKFVELMFAGQGQLEAEQNKRQTIQKMQARMKQGYWVFSGVKGYRYEKSKHGGKVLVRHEPLASILQEGLEGFASGRFQTKSELGRFWAGFPEYSTRKSGEAHGSRVDDLLNRVIYAGYLEYPKWGIKPIPAKHEGLITYETYLKIQQRLKDGAYAPTRKNINADFPLRGFVSCSCGTPMTASWSKGRNTHYAYYSCQTKTCEHNRKSIKRDVIEGEFENILKQLTPPEHLMDVYSDMVKEEWDYHVEHAGTRHKSLQSLLVTKDREIDKMLDRIVESDMPSVVRAFERKIKTYEDEKRVIEEKLSNCGRPLKGFDETYRTALQFLANPHSLWASGALEYQRAVLKLAFTERLTYVRGEGYRTAKTTLPFKGLGGFNSADNKMAERVGFEPTKGY